MGNKHDKPLLLQNPSKIKDIIIPIKKLYIPPFSNIQKFANKNIKTKLKLQKTIRWKKVPKKNL